jgi:molybdopterin/thiamine biosynthesis adenylyltransferase
MELWWNRAERLHWELSELVRRGFRYDPPGNLEAPGPFLLRVYAPWRGEEVALDVTFPELYPYFRCEVRAEDLDLKRHQNPFEKNLCLLGRGTDRWEPSDSLAWLLTDQLPKLAASLDAYTDSAAAALEEVQAEPISDYYRYSSGGDVVLVDSSWKIPPEFDRGRIELGYAKPQSDNAPFRAVVREITWLDGRPLLRAPDHLLGLFPDTISGELVRLDPPLLVNDPEKFQRRLGRPERWQGHAVSQRHVLGIVFPEESSWRGESGQGWLFVVGAKARNAYRANYRFVRADRAGVLDLTSRAPDLRPLREHKVAVVGLGCLGAPSALEFARAGVGELRLLDRDRVDAAGSIRWPFGLAYAGLWKVEVLHSFIRSHYPLTKTIEFVHALGAGGPDISVLHQVLDGATLVYDAAAEVGISYVLAEWARHAKIPYVVVSSLQGAWGGQVARLLPGGATGCWYCLQRAKTEGQIPAPPYDPDREAWFQPTGCADPTFTGGGFDLSSIATAGVRLAIATMLVGQEAYPSSPDDVLIFSWRDEHGALITPRASGFPLSPFSDCPVCGSQVASG